jgi:hypothetical protein
MFDLQQASSQSGGTFTDDDVSGNFVDPAGQQDVGGTEPV